MFFLTDEQAAMISFSFYVLAFVLIILAGVLIVTHIPKAGDSRVSQKKLRPIPPNPRTLERSKERASMCKDLAVNFVEMQRRLESIDASLNSIHAQATNRGSGYAQDVEEYFALCDEYSEQIAKHGNFTAWVKHLNSSHTQD